jgi:hypothetical protein
MGEAQPLIGEVSLIVTAILNLDGLVGMVNQQATNVCRPLRSRLARGLPTIRQ